MARFFEIVRRQGGLLRDDRLPFLVAQLDTLIETGDDPSTADVDLDEGDAVHVLTYHKAKGLEFGVVFMVGLVDDRFPGRERRDALELPDALVSEPVAGRRPARRGGAAALLRRHDPRSRGARPELGAGLRRPSLAQVSRFVAEALDLPPATPLETIRPALLEQLARHQASPTAPAPAPRDRSSATVRCRSATARSTTISTARRATDTRTSCASRRRPRTRWSTAARCTPRCRPTTAGSWPGRP